jgi:hypothetical protein
MSPWAQEKANTSAAARPFGLCVYARRVLSSTVPPRLAPADLLPGKEPSPGSNHNHGWGRELHVMIFCSSPISSDIVIVTGDDYVQLFPVTSTTFASVFIIYYIGIPSSKFDH